MRSRRAPRMTHAQLIQMQEDWIKDHGGSLAGYIERYGPVERVCPSAPRLTRHSADCEICGGKETYIYTYGDGGAAIYKADTDALAALRATPNRARR